MNKPSIILSTVAIMSLFIGCGSGGGDNKITRVATPTTQQTLKKTSNTTKASSSKLKVQKQTISTQKLPILNDFSNNPHVIDANTMVNWIQDWKRNRPPEVNGKLIILQVGPAFLSDNDHTFIKHDDKDIFTFDKAGGCSNTDPMFDRTDGVAVIPKAVLSGEMMDISFKMYDIDPNNDMLLIVAGGDKKLKGKTENAAVVARFAWSMKYWGMAHYATLDGNIESMLNPNANPSIKEQGINSIDDLFVKDASKPPMSGTHTIKEVKHLNQDIIVTLDEMMDVVRNCPKSAFIIDSRSKDEYEANNEVKKSKTEAKICGKNHNEQCYTAIEGHIKGAKHIEYKDFIVTDDAMVDANRDGKVDGMDASFRYKNIDDMLKILTDKGFDPKTQTLYTYCRTGTRAALPAYIGTNILKVDTKLFDGSWIEWGRLAGKEGIRDVNGDKLLNCDSPWRTDVSDLTQNLKYNPSNLVAPLKREGTKLEASQYANDASKIKCDDLSYISK